MRRTTNHPLPMILLAAVAICASTQPSRAFAAQAWAAYQLAGTKALETKDYAKAVANFSSALTEAQATGNQEHAAQSILGVATALVDDGKYEDAHKILSKAVEICHLHSPVSQKTRGTLRTILSLAHAGRGQHDAAIREASSALSHLEQAQDADEEIVRVLAHLAHLKATKGDHVAAEALASHAVQLALSRPAVSGDAKAVAHVAHGQSLAASGNHADAVAAVEKAKAAVAGHDPKLTQALDQLRASLTTEALSAAAKTK